MADLGFEGASLLSLPSARTPGLSHTRPPNKSFSLLRTFSRVRPRRTGIVSPLPAIYPECSTVPDTQEGKKTITV